MTKTNLNVTMRTNVKKETIRTPAQREILLSACWNDAPFYYIPHAKILIIAALEITYFCGKCILIYTLYIELSQNLFMALMQW